MSSTVKGRDGRVYTRVEPKTVTREEQSRMARVYANANELYRDLFGPMGSFGQERTQVADHVERLWPHPIQIPAGAMRAILAFLADLERESVSVADIARYRRVEERHKLLH